MKKIRVASLVMAIVMLAMCAVSCSKSEKVNINCTISVYVGEEVYLDSYAYTVQGTVDNPPTVLQAASEAFTIMEFPYEVDDKGQSFTCITLDGVDYATGMNVEGTAIGLWEYTADGVAPKEGRAGTNAVLEGQHIVFNYSEELLDPQEFSSGEE